jgi:hypothetical protein
MAGANTLALKKDEKADDLLIVRDPSCTPTSKERTHELMIDGEPKPYTFKHGEEMKLPRPEAMKFLKAGFTVLDGGKKIEQTPEQPTNGKIVLGENQTVATFNELSQEALWKRCVQEVGGEKFSRSDPRREMEAFLIKRKSELEQARKGAAENGVEDFTPPAENDE